jgi:hypothetical protein
MLDCIRPLYDTPIICTIRVTILSQKHSVSQTHVVILRTYCYTKGINLQKSYFRLLGITLCNDTYGGKFRKLIMPCSDTRNTIT